MPSWTKEQPKANNAKTATRRPQNQAKKPKDDKTHTTPLMKQIQAIEHDNADLPYQHVASHAIAILNSSIEDLINLEAITDRSNSYAMHALIASKVKVTKNMFELIALLKK